MTKKNNQMVLCPICNGNLKITLARGRKSGKPFIMFMCPEDGRHFRGFITHRPFVENVLKKAEAKGQSENGNSKAIPTDNKLLR